MLLSPLLFAVLTPATHLLLGQRPLGPFLPEIEALW
jgi:hypothetical protein